MVGGGIGVTPYASILNDLVFGTSTNRLVQTQFGIALRAANVCSHGRDHPTGQQSRQKLGRVKIGSRNIFYLKGWEFSRSRLRFSECIVGMSRQILR